MRGRRFLILLGVVLGSLLTMSIQGKAQNLSLSNIDSLNQKGFLLVHLRDSNAFSFLNEVMAIAQDEKYTKGQAGAYHNLGIYYSNRQNYDSARYCVNKALELSMSINDSLRIFISYSTLGTISYFEGAYGQAEQLYKKAISYRSERLYPGNLAELYLSLAMLYNIRSEYSQALTYLFKGDSLLAEIPENIVHARYKSNIATVYMNIKEYDKAMKYYLLALKYYEHLDLRQNIAEIYNNIGVLYDKQGQWDRALEYYQKSLVIYLVQDNDSCVATCYSNIGNALRNQKAYDKAIVYLEKALALKRALKDLKGSVFSYLTIAEIYLANNMPARAMSYLDSSWNLSNRLKMQNEKVLVLTLMAKAATALEDYKKAYDLQKRAMSQRDSLFTSEKSKAIAELETKYELRQQQQQLKIKNQTIALLNREKKIKNLHTRVLLLLAVIVSLFSVLIIYRLRLKVRYKQEIILRKKKLIKTNQELNHAKLRVVGVEKEKLCNELENNKETLRLMAFQVIKKNDFIAAIQKELKNIQKTAKESETRKRLSQLFNLIKIDANLDTDREKFQQATEKLNTEFLTRLNQEYPDLTPDERKLCVYLLLKLSSKEIATLFGISVSSADMKRYRLRKKLKLNSGENISEFLQKVI